jgi:hypothetical protein
MQEYDVENSFKYHPPKDDQAERYEIIRESARLLATTIIENSPSSAERTKALRDLEQAVMWANASIARNE